MSKCPKCGKYIEPNILGRKRIQCKGCSVILVENRKHAANARLGVIIIVFLLPILLSMFVTDDVTTVFFIVAPLALIYLNIATKYEVYDEADL